MGFNYQSLAYFGLRWLKAEDSDGSLSNVAAWGIPTFMSPSSQILEENSQLLDNIYKRDDAENCKVRRLVLAFDRTYLVTATQLLKTHLGPCLCGGAHRPEGFEIEGQSLFKINRDEGQEQFDIKGRLKANEMESYLIWDPSRLHSPTIEVASFPCLSSATKHKHFEEVVANPKHCRGKFETLMRLGEVLKSQGCVRFLLADAQASSFFYMNRFYQKGKWKNHETSDEIR